MSIDLTQFKDVFFEESFEGLDVMESHLLDLDEQDNEALNAIFRAAHSIKGGAGMFGFTHIVDFTHVVETLLDEMRSNKRNVSEELVSLLLRANDSIKTLLELAKDDITDFPDTVQEVQQNLQQVLDGEPASSAAEVTTEETAAPTGTEVSGTSAAAAGAGWLIHFKPSSELLQTGNEPLHMFSALEDLGKLEVECHSEKVPTLDELCPTECYLSWTLKLHGQDIPKEEVEEVFAWVEDLCELEISILDEDQPGTPATASEAKTTQAPTFVAEVTAKEPPEPEAKGTLDRRQGDRRRQTDRRQSLDRRGGSESNSLRVSIEKIDTLINRVGELVITQSMLSQITHVEDLSQLNLERLQEGLAQLERNTREIQEDVMQIRMLPISFVFNRFPRLAHDLQAQLGKQIELVISGQETELDKTLMEKLSDPLVHLVRNSIDHGIEMPAQRLEAGKQKAGQVELNAYHQGGNIIIEIKDDGQGLNTEKILAKAIDMGVVSAGEQLEDHEIFNLIMQPGFSTAEKVTDLSGRGVGMDVVARNISELGGNIEIESSAGKGSCFRISLPLTLAILDGQQAQIDEQIYIIPLVSIIESLQVPMEQIRAIAGKDQLYSFRGDYIPLVNLRQAMGHNGSNSESNLIVVVEASNQRYGLIVDELLGQQQFVIKSLEENYQRVEGVAGATILGSGKVGLIIDIAGVLKLHRRQNLKRIA